MEQCGPEPYAVEVVQGRVALVRSAAPGDVLQQPNLVIDHSRVDAAALQRILGEVGAVGVQGNNVFAVLSITHHPPVVHDWV